MALLMNKKYLWLNIYYACDLNDITFTLIMSFLVESNKDMIKGYTVGTKYVDEGWLILEGEAKRIEALYDVLQQVLTKRWRFGINKLLRIRKHCPVHLKQIDVNKLLSPTRL